MEPFDWNIVIAASWNRAILTPGWIKERMFELPKDATVNVLVPLDGQAPYQVRYEHITVIPIPGQLVLQTSEPTTEQLDEAAAVAIRALNALPHTPYLACGVNLRFHTVNPSNSFLANNRCESERLLAEGGFQVQNRRRGESIVYEEGMLNIQTEIPTEGETVAIFNFELTSSDHDALVNWLRKPAADIMNAATRILGSLE